eukprot:COSAG02_NODE_28_length_51367_cov_70.053932_32_plen_65_part_00
MVPRTIIVLVLDVHVPGVAPVARIACRPGLLAANVFKDCSYSQCTAPGIDIDIDIDIFGFMNCK